MPITDSTLPIDRVNTPLMWGEVADLGNAIIWKFENAATDQPLTNAVNTTPGLLLFGWGVVRGNAGADTSYLNSTVIYPSGPTDIFEGIVFASDTFENRLGYSMDAAGRYGYPPPVAAGTLPGNPNSAGMTVSVIRKADRICVPIETAVSRGDAVHMRALAGGTARGAFRNAAVAGETIAIARARFLTTVAAPSAGTLGVGYIALEGVI